MKQFQYQAGGRVIFGAGATAQVGTVIREQGARHILLVTDPGVRAAGLVEPVLSAMTAVGAAVGVFDGVEANPDTGHVQAGIAFAKAQSRKRPQALDLILAVGGGSAMDCAKGINFLLTNGGAMKDYQGLDKATEPMLPSVGIPTTAGTGSEAQSYALIAEKTTHRKMACGDRKARFGTVILDPDVLASVPKDVAAATGIDAVAHTLETFVANNSNTVSRMYSREAWRLIEQNFESYLAPPENGPAREAMMLGSYLAGTAIEASMLGAAHASANPLTANFGITHGTAVGLMLPHVIRFNGGDRPDLYQGLHAYEEAEAMAVRVEELRAVAGLPSGLRAVGVDRDALESLSRDAVEEWTGGYNPRPLTAPDFFTLYEAAL